jgi:hypothetical protein
MTSRHRLPTLLAAGAATIAVAGCGGSSADDGSAGQQDDSKQLAFAQCLRKAGIDAPDPTTGPGGRVSQRIRVPRGISKQRVGQITADCARKTGGGPKPMSKEDQAKFRDAALKFARCMRAHGVKVADPKIDRGGAGNFRVGGPGISPQVMKRADAACRTYMEAAAPKLSAAQRAEMRDQAVKFARCMRQHGVNLPDPETVGGGFRITRRASGGPGKGPAFNPDSPAFRAAQQACQSLNPKMRLQSQGKP